jgi:nitrogen regulatory protein PII
MKKIEAIIRTWTLEAVHNALQAVGIDGLTVSEVVGFGREPAQTSSYRGTTYTPDWRTRLRIEIVAPDADVGPIVQAIVTVTSTRRVGDGLVTILPVTEAVRIRTGERGTAAVTSSSVLAGVRAPHPTGARARLRVAPRRSPQ